MKAWIYGRVSTKDQADNGVSKNDQITRGKGFIQSRSDLELGKILFDDCSTKTPLADRRGGRRLMEAIESGECKMVIVTKMDRAFRTAPEIMETITEWADKGVAFKCLDQGFDFDTSTANGRLILNFMAAIAQFERDQTGERTKAAMSHIKSQIEENGHHVSRRSGRTITSLGRPKGSVDPAKERARKDKMRDAADVFHAEMAPKVLEVIQDLHRRGGNPTYDDIAHELNKRSHYTRRGKSWSGGTFHRAWERITGDRMNLIPSDVRTDREKALSWQAPWEVDTV